MEPTDGSNLPSSSGESVANLTFGGEEQGAVAVAPPGEALREYPRQTLLGFGVTLHGRHDIARVYMTNYMSFGRQAAARTMTRPNTPRSSRQRRCAPTMPTHQPAVQ
jgi:hypothetical protein